MRYQLLPDNVFPLHDVLHVLPDTRATVITFMFRGRTAFRTAEVAGRVRSATPSQVVTFGYCVVVLKSPVAA